MNEDMNLAEQNGKPRRLVVSVHKLFQAGLGAVALTQDELSDLANRLVEKGEKTEDKSRQRIDDLLEERRQAARESTERVESELDKQMERVLHRLNIPTRAEIQALNAKITRLTKKVDELNKTQRQN